MRREYLPDPLSALLQQRKQPERLHAKTSSRGFLIVRANAHRTPVATDFRHAAAA